MSPTTRCAALVLLLAFAALILPLALVALAALALLAATIADGLAVRSAPQLQRELSPVLARGVAAPLRVRALSGDRRRVLLRQPATPTLRVRLRGGGQELHGELLAERRGRHRLPALAAASVGPLGLARWHHRAGEVAELLVYPDLPRARRLALQLRQGRAAPDGRLRRGPLGVGTDFESIREYSPDDDIRHVNWRASARMGRPMTNSYRVEQGRDVIFLIDAGRLMAAPAGAGRAPASLLDVALDAAAAVAVVADDLGDHCGAIAFDAGIRRSIAPRRLGGRGVVHALFDLQPELVDSDFERAFMAVGAARRALVFVLTDLVDERAAGSLLQAAPMLARRHAVVVASAGDACLEEIRETVGTPQPPLPGREGRLGAGDSGAAQEALALAALSVMQAREAAVVGLRRAGADVVVAPAARLSQRCLQAYLRAQARARL